MFSNGINANLFNSPSSGLYKIACNVRKLIGRRVGFKTLNIRCCSRDLPFKQRLKRRCRTFVSCNVWSVWMCVRFWCVSLVWTVYNTSKINVGSEPNPRRSATAILIDWSTFRQYCLRLWWHDDLNTILNQLGRHLQKNNKQNKTTNFSLFLVINWCRKIRGITNKKFFRMNLHNLNAS